VVRSTRLSVCSETATRKSSKIHWIKAMAAERSCVLSDGEIRLAWGVFDAVGGPFGPIAKTQHHQD
jgi:hypothetical protein